MSRLDYLFCLEAQKRNVDWRVEVINASMPTYSIRVPRFKSELHRELPAQTHTSTSKVASVILGGADSSRTWFPVSKMEDLVIVLGSWLWPGSAVVVDGAWECGDISVCLSRCLSAFQNF